MFACTKFGRNRSGDIDFRAQKPPQMFGVKEVAFKKYHKKYFTRLYMSRYHFIPTNPLLAALRIFSFFQNIVRPSPKRRTTETNKTKLYHMRYCDVQTMQTKFARFCQKKQWLWNWTPPMIWRNRRAWPDDSENDHADFESVAPPKLIWNKSKK